MQFVQRSSIPGSIGRSSVVATSARTLISSIPGAGSYLSPVSDFAFKSIGISSRLPTSVTDKVDTRIIGLGTEFEVPIGFLVSNSQQVINAYRGVGSDHEFLTRYYAGRLLSITISATPANKSSKRQGEWALSFTPFISSGDASEYVSNVKVVPTYNSVSSRPGAVFGSASTTLTISYRVPVDNVFLQLYHSWGTAIGVIALAYQNTLRDNPTEFSASEVAPEIAITGTVAMDSPSIQENRYFNAVIKDLLSEIASSIFVNSSTGGGSFIQDSKYRCQVAGDKCILQGTFRKAPPRRHNLTKKGRKLV